VSRAPKPKTNRKGDKDTSQNYDRCYTPPYAIEPLLAYLSRDLVIWEPCAGAGDLARALRSRGYTVIATELVDERRDGVIGGKNFFTWAPDHFDIIITNPPYSIKPAIYARCEQLGCPFALLVPVETIGSGDLHPLFERINHQQLLLDSRVDFKMPSHMTWLEGSAQFPTFWSCRGLLDKPVAYGKIKALKKAFKREQKRLQLLADGQLELGLLAA